MNNIFIVTLPKLPSFFTKGIDQFTCSLWVGNLPPDTALLRDLLEKGGGPFLFAGKNAEVWEDAMDQIIITFPGYVQRDPYPSTVSFLIEDPLKESYLFDSMFTFAYEHPVLFLLVHTDPGIEKRLHTAVMGYNESTQS